MSSASDKKKKYKVIGTRPVRHDGADKVTGRAIYGADLRLTGTVHGRILRSPHPHAKIEDRHLGSRKTAGRAGRGHRAPIFRISRTRSPTWAKAP